MVGLLLGPSLESVAVLLGFEYDGDKLGLGNQVRIIVSDALSLRGKEVDAIELLARHLPKANPSPNLARMARA